MQTGKILIITDKKNRTEKFSLSPYDLPIENFFATGLDSLEYIGLHGYSSVVIDFEVANLLRKIALGISDDTLSEAMWALLAPDTTTKVYVLTDKISPPTRDMVALGLEFVLASGLSELIKTTDIKFSNTFGLDASSTGIMTADDVRTLSKSGNMVLEPGVRMTSWAKEIADTLGIKESIAETIYIVPVEAQAKSQLIDKREEYFSLSTAHNGLLFAMPSPLIPIFNELFPSLSRRVVSIGINWEIKGAFTGETSIDMLVDMGCHGAIIVNEKPYTKSENISKLLKLIGSTGFKLFSFFPLAQEAECGIIDPKDKSLLIPLVDARVAFKRSSASLEALIVDNNYLEKIRKGI